MIRRRNRVLLECFKNEIRNLTYNINHMITHLLMTCPLLTMVLIGYIKQI